MRLRHNSIPWLLFSFKGRIARQSFLLSIVLLLLPQFWLISKIIENNGNIAALLPLASIWLLLTFATVWPIAALIVKRLHDWGKPGALLLLALVPGLNWLFFFALALIPGSSEANEYGPPRIDRN